MEFLDYEKLDAIDANEFRVQRPFPWVNPEGVLTDQGYRKLVATLPPVSRFAPVFGVARAHGQGSHDRYVLEYDESLDVDPAWHQFAAEIHGERYGRFVRRLFGRGFFRFTCHWHYTPNGCAVFPHCDAKRKLGSHIFYLNTADDWDPAWGGQTVVLDDRGRFPRESAPRFEDFDLAVDSQSVGNWSFLFQRNAKSWHGVREIHCPEDRYRKVFIVVVEDWARSVRHRVVSRLKGKKAAAY